MASSSGTFIDWVLPQRLRWNSSWPWVCCWFVVRPSSNTDTLSLFTRSGCMCRWIRQDRMFSRRCNSWGISVTRIWCENIKCFCETVVLLPCDPVIQLPWRPQYRCPSVVFRIILLCPVLCCLTGNFGKLFSQGLCPSQIPSLLGTAQPSWREMPVANYTQVDWLHRKYAHICVCLPVTLFVFVTVFIRNPKRLLLLYFFKFRTSALFMFLKDSPWGEAFQDRFV